MQPYYFVLLLFAVCLAHAFFQVYVDLKNRAFLKYCVAFPKDTVMFSKGAPLSMFKNSIVLSDVDDVFIGVAKESGNMGDTIRMMMLDSVRIPTAFLGNRKKTGGNESWKI